jgi:preprotein translocase subunit SecG
MHLTVQKIKQAKFTLFLAQVFGATLIFPAEVAKAEQTLLESQITPQNTIDSCEALPQLAQSNLTKALQSAEETLQCAWMLIAETFTLFIGIPTVIMLIALVLMKRHQRR